MYAFKKIPDGFPHIGKSIIQGGFEDRALAEVYALAWLEDGKLTVLLSEPDEAEDAIDIMAARGHGVFQYAIERE